MRSEILKKEINVKIEHKGVETGDTFKGSDKWIITIEGQTLDYFTGSGHRKNGKPVYPKLDDVLHCLVMDSEASNMSFADWCSVFGYDTDSRKALATYESCQISGDKLRKIGINTEKAREAFQDY